MAEILLAIGVLAMPAGIDEHDVAGLDRRLDLFEMDRRMHRRRGMEDGSNLVCHYALLRVMGDAFELDLLITGKNRRIHAPRMAEFDEGKSAFWINHLCHYMLLLMGSPH